jgi:hypothetical protein
MTGPYDITWAQWAWGFVAFVVLVGIAFVVLAWRDRRRKK